MQLRSPHFNAAAIATFCQARLGFDKDRAAPVLRSDLTSALMIQSSSDAEVRKLAPGLGHFDAKLLFIAFHAQARTGLLENGAI